MCFPVARLKSHRLQMTVPRAKAAPQEGHPAADNDGASGGSIICVGSKTKLRAQLGHAIWVPTYPESAATCCPQCGHENLMSDTVIVLSQRWLGFYHNRQSYDWQEGIPTNLIMACEESHLPKVFWHFSGLERVFCVQRMTARL